MLDKTQIMQMIDEVKGSLSKLESALGTEGESEMPAEESSEMGGSEAMAGTEESAMPAEEGKEEMPPMLKKFMRG